MFVRSLLLAVLLSLAAPLRAVTYVESAAVPDEMKSYAFSIKVNGKPIDVAHAAASYEYASFTMSGPVEIEITAAEKDFWQAGVDVEPWRLGIRPTRTGETIRFKLDKPAKLAISRPRDFLNRAKMLFIFAGSPEPPLPRQGPIKAYLPGVYHQSIDAKSGETIYLMDGAYFYGTLNLDHVENVKILGHGTIVHDGPQDPNTDEGWMQRPDWHCIGAYEARNVKIEGLTCIVRSRTWSIQMKDSAGLEFNDIRVIGGNPGNANQDGMDWLGGGDTIVRDSFFRTSDDVFAMQGNWDGYTDADLLRPGHDVQNITIENSVLSTSISNIVRSAWPRKTFNQRNFTLRNSDVLHAGIGACGQTFGLFGYWGAKGFTGTHQGYTFENLFLDNWYSLAQIERDKPELSGVVFRNIWALDQPPLVASLIGGPVSEVTLENVKLGQKTAERNADVPVSTYNGAAPVRYLPSQGPVAAFTFDQPYLRPAQPVTFTAQENAGAKYTWFFGDGTQAAGRVVTHSFADAEGTELNGAATGAGRFRVLLRVEDAKGREDWAAQGVVVVGRWRPALPLGGDLRPGLNYTIYPGMETALPDVARKRESSHGESNGLQANALGFTRYTVAWEGFLNVPADGGYTFHLLDRDGARVIIDGVEVARTGPAFAQVCGASGNAMRYERGSLGLRAGAHTIRVEGLHAASASTPRLLWEGPALPLTDVPDAAFRHAPRVELKAASPAAQKK